MDPIPPVSHHNPPSRPNSAHTKPFLIWKYVLFLAFATLGYSTPTTTGNAGALPAFNGPITPTRPPGAPPPPGTP